MPFSAPFHLARKAALALGLALIVGLSLTPEARAEESAGASMAPTFAVEGIDGQTYDLAALLQRGPVYLDFWTTWCGPCQMALPKLDELHKKYAEAGFTLLTVASDDQKTVSKVKPHVKSKGWEFPVIIDAKRELGNKYNVRAFPTSFLIGQDGKILSTHQGYRPGDEKELEKELIALLGDKKVKVDAKSETEGGSH